MSEEDDYKLTKLKYASSNSRSRKMDNRYLNPTDYDDYDDDTENEYSRSRSEIVTGEWIECQEIVSGRHLFYNSITMEIVFDHNPSNKNKRNIKNDDLTSDDIAADHITDDEIASYLLKFSKSKWEFNNDSVCIYRLQCSSIDHTLMLPHPISMQFPEFFSTNTIPSKKQFVAQILPPKDNTLFPTTSKQWKVRVIVDKTTAKQLIHKIVDKLKISLNTEEYGANPQDIVNRASEFILKVVGCEEYILYDDTKLIVDYEAVRKAVRNEDDVIFQLDHRPDLIMIEQECFDKNIWHIMQFDKKYDNARLLTNKIRDKYQYCKDYVKFGYGQGMSLNEINIANKNNGFTKEYQLQQHQQIISNKTKLNKQPILPIDIPPPPPPLTNIPPPPSVTPPLSHTMSVDDVAAHDPSNNDEDKVQYTPKANGGMNNIQNLLNADDWDEMTRQRSSSHGHQSSNNKAIMNQFASSMKTLSGQEILNNIPSLADTNYLSDIIPLKSSQIREKKEIKEMLLHEFAQFYRIKMSFMTNVTHLPRFKFYFETLKQKKQSFKNKGLTVIVRHELWIGDLRYDSCTFSTDCKTQISDGMRFLNSQFLQSNPKEKWCDLARESCISFTVFLCKLSNISGLDDASKYEFMMPLAFSRFPIISACNILRSGKYALNLWPIPLYIAEYKGAKCDPWINLAFRYRGTTTDRRFKQIKKVSKIDKLTGKDQEHLASASADRLNIWKLGIEFETRKFKVIAPPLNHRLNYKAAHLKVEAQRLSRRATENLSSLVNGNNTSPKKDKERSSFMRIFSRSNKDSEEKNDEWQRVHSIINADMLYEFSASDRSLIWKYRDELCVMPSSLNCFIRCVDWRLPSVRSEAYDYILKWRSSPYLEDSLELLSYEYMDTYVREYSVMRIAAMSDSDLQRYLLQLVQCLKYELHHNNALIRLLMRRALSNPHQIGHFFFWHIFSEYQESNQLNIMYLERFGLYLEEYLLFSQIGVSRDILCEINLCKSLSRINSKLRLEKSRNKNIDKTTLKKHLHLELGELNSILPNTFILPINPRWRCTQFVISECKTMDSAQMPLWLSCKNVDDSNDSTIIMFKTGDDLRQDILTLQVLRVMDKVWLDRGLNLRLLPYNVVSTGDGQGMVEIVLASATTTYIHTKYGGGPQKGARDITTHLKYISLVNNNNIIAINKARDIYSRSCAGYCIASYVLGLGDRHPSNIMVRNKGELFHIDFSHFLGNFKSQNIIGDYVKWQREVAPFVFLPAYKYCINNANRDEDKYNEFVQFAVNAYLALRQRHRLLINLFILMLPSMMPELIQKEHINYLRDQLHLTNIKNENVYQHITKIIKVCLNDKRRIIDNTFHALKHQ